jgi:hypothetical protein
MKELQTSLKLDVSSKMSSLSIMGMFGCLTRNVKLAASRQSTVAICLGIDDASGSEGLTFQQPETRRVASLARSRSLTSHYYCPTIKQSCSFLVGTNQNWQLSSLIPAFPCNPRLSFARSAHRFRSCTASAALDVLFTTSERRRSGRSRADAAYL